MDAVDVFFTIVWVIIYFVLIGFFGSFVLYFAFKTRRKKAQEEREYNLTFLHVKLPQENETEIKLMEHLFSSLAGLRKSFWQSLNTGQYRLSLEIISKEEGIGFYIVVPDELSTIVEKQINADYPNAEIDIIDPNEVWDRGSYTSVAELTLSGAEYYPIKTYEDLGGDAINTLTSSMSSLAPDEVVSIQFIINPASDNWRKAGQSFLHKVRSSKAEGKGVNIDENFLQGVEKKLAKPGFDVAIRIVSISRDKFAAEKHIQTTLSAFSQFADVRYTKFKTKRMVSSKKIVDEFIYRRVNNVDWFIPIFNFRIRRTTSVLNTEELATMFHFPNKEVQTPNIIWLGAKKAAAPVNTPEEGLYLGKSIFRGVKKEIYIKDDDRRRHMYIIGQTGTGKSQFLQAMALQDINKGNGLAVIDPHGSDIEYILERIPEHRKDDVILFDVSDTQRPMGINILEAKTDEQKNMLINSFIGLLYKIYDPNKTGMIGPQLERTVRNVMLTAMSREGSTMIDVLRLLIDPNYYKEYLPLVKDPLVVRYWTDEIENTNDFHKSEKLGYFVSKFDRFVTEKIMRNIVGQPYSAFNFPDMMDQKKIFLAKLSKGLVGEENAQFLGLILVPRILVAALGRANKKHGEDFPDYYLYVDEFQNFATPDFATILSEARKYKLNLTVANQFIAQLSEEIKTAVFGNVGTVASFRVGIDDSQYLAEQFEPTFDENDLMKLSTGNCYMRLLIDSQPSQPFSMNIEWDKERNDLSLKYSDVEPSKERAEMIRQLSRMKYGRDIVEVDKLINENIAPPPKEEPARKLPFGDGKLPF